MAFFPRTYTQITVDTPTVLSGMWLLLAAGLRRAGGVGDAADVLRLRDSVALLP